MLMCIYIYIQFLVLYQVLALNSDWEGNRDAPYPVRLIITCLCRRSGLVVSRNTMPCAWLVVMNQHSVFKNIRFLLL